MTSTESRFIINNVRLVSSNIYTFLFLLINILPKLMPRVLQNIATLTINIKHQDELLFEGNKNDSKIDKVLYVVGLYKWIDISFILTRIITVIKEDRYWASWPGWRNSKIDSSLRRFSTSIHGEWYTTHEKCMHKSLIGSKCGTYPFLYFYVVLIPVYISLWY